MKNTLATLTLVSLTFAAGMNAQTHRQVAASTGHADLNTTLADLDRVAQATQGDIASLHVEKWKAGWKSGFLKDGAHKDQAQQAAGSLQLNLANALPGLIHDVQTSRGSLSATFKLYDDVSLVCEAVDSLIAASEAEGKKRDAAPLVDDYSAMARVRRSLSNYIQQSSASMESRGVRTTYAAAAPAAQPAARQVAATAPAAPQIEMDQGVKKIIVDDTQPEKKSATAPATTTTAAAAPVKKKQTTTLTNL